MNKKKSTTKRSESITLHGLLGAVSYWGTATRFMLVSILVFVAFLANVAFVDVSSANYIIGEVQILIYALIILVTTDLLYVLVARSLPLEPKFDRWALIAADVVIASCFIAPSFLTIASAHSTGLRVMSPIVALLVVGMRILVGLLYSKKENK